MAGGIFQPFFYPSCVVVHSNQVKAAIASALVATGATLVQLSAAFDAIDAVPLLQAPSGYSPPVASFQSGSQMEPQVAPSPACEEHAASDYQTRRAASSVHAVRTPSLSSDEALTPFDALDSLPLPTAFGVPLPTHCAPQAFTISGDEEATDTCVDGAEVGASAGVHQAASYPEQARVHTPPPPRKRRLRASCWSTDKLAGTCRRFSRAGKCVYGDACRFEHALIEGVKPSGACNDRLSLARCAEEISSEDELAPTCIHDGGSHVFIPSSPVAAEEEAESSRTRLRSPRTCRKRMRCSRACRTCAMSAKT